MGSVRSPDTIRLKYLLYFVDIYEKCRADPMLVRMDAPVDILDGHAVIVDDPPPICTVH